MCELNQKNIMVHILGLLIVKPFLQIKFQLDIELLFMDDKYVHTFYNPTITDFCALVMAEHSGSLFHQTG